MQSISSQQRLTAHYKTALGALLAAIGAVSFAFSLWTAIQASQFSLLLVVGLLMFAFGLYCLKRPYFLLEPHQITVYNLLGSVSKRYTFDSWEVVKADSRRIYIDDDGITKKVSVLPLLASTEDWLTMREMLQKR